MKTHRLRNTLRGFAVLALIGSVGAETYYAHRLAERIEALQAKPAGDAAPPLAAIANTPWAAMHADMMAWQAGMARLFDASRGDMDDTSFATAMAQAPISLEEQDDTYVVTAALPGAGDNDVNVDLDGRVLRIVAATENTQTQTTDDGQWRGQQHVASHYEQALTLPGPVDAAAMSSQFHDGVLTVMVPKAAS